MAAPPIVAGCDVGSTTGKALLMRGEEVLGFSIIPCAVRPELTAEQALELAMREAEVSSREDIAYVVGTGYGRVRIPFADENVSEITCHGLGAYFLRPGERTLIDIGGQDCKVIRINSQGRVVDFAMNDKCAAGTGRFFEAMARVLEVSLEELTSLSLRSVKPAQITSQCSVFAESEVITLLNEGVALEDIAAGINEAIASRLAVLVRKVGLEGEASVSGGCAKNRGLILSLERRLQVKVEELGMDPQVIGALGAAVIAGKKAMGASGGGG
ncbi:acyl-CoA dehydratase activase [Candidatus Solincola sp.]|nr:acyl-CoA dehydratase activase [Actinomycetota bacterium]